MKHLKPFDRKGKKGNDTFVRFGGVSLVNQRNGSEEFPGYNPSMPTFHAPPSSRGIYAFPLKAIELFNKILPPTAPVPHKAPAAPY